MKDNDSYSVLKEDTGAYSVLELIKGFINALQDNTIVTQEDGRVLTKNEIVDAAVLDLLLYRKYHLNKDDNKKVITGVQFGRSLR